MKRFLVGTLGFACALSALLFAAGSSATITGTSGQVQLIAAPPSVKFGALQSDTTMYAFDEQQRVVLAAPLDVDITVPGTYDENSDLTPGAIPAGTLVSSHFVHADKVGKQP